MAAAVAPFCLFLFDRAGRLLYRREWREQRDSVREKADQAKSIYGVIATLEPLAPMLAAKPVEGKVQRADVSVIRTTEYALHQFRPVTGWRFVLMTNKDCPDCSRVLAGVYASIFVPLIMRNPLVDPSEPIALPRFDANVDAMLRSVGADLGAAGAASAPAAASE